MSPLSPQHRRSLFTSLSPIVGEEEADALLDQLPRTDAEVPVTKADLGLELADVRTEMRTGFADVRTEMRTGFAEVRTEIAEVRTDVQTQIGTLRTEMQQGFTRLSVLVVTALLGGLSVSTAVIALIARSG